MSRNMQSGGRSRMGLSESRGIRNYGNAGKMRGHAGPGVLGSGPTSLMGGGGGGGYGMGGGLGGRDGGGYEMDSLLQQRSLQQQLSLRESQLALANSLLQQQQQQSQMISDSPRMGMQGMGQLGMGHMGGLGGMSGLGGGSMMMNKRHLDLASDFQPYMKRPRTEMSQPRDRYRNRSSDVGNRGSNNRRNQTSSATSSRPYRSSDRDSSGKGRKDSVTEEKYDPEDPTGDDEERKDGEPRSKSDKHHCYVCNINCRDDEGFSRHMNSKRHKDCMFSVLSIHEEKSSQIKSQMVSRIKAEKHLRNLEDEDKKRKPRGFCKVCDISLEIFYEEHVRTVFHKKRALQVNKGCGWCGVPSFVNFSAVLSHRETEEHQKNQELHSGKNKDSRGRRDSDTRHERRSETKASEKKRAPIKVDMPESLTKFDPEVAVGQTCVVPVSGWFCKLCNKFYNNETAAKDTHCKTESHFGKYKRFIYAKLRAKAEEALAAAEKAAEEEEKIKKAAASKEDENGTGEKDDKEEAKEESTEKEVEDETTAREEEEKGVVEEEGADPEEDMLDDGAMLATDAEGSNLDFMDEDVESEDRLLNEMENNEYQTADEETFAADSFAEAMEGDETGLSLEPGDSTTDLQESTTDLQESTSDLKESTTELQDSSQTEITEGVEGGQAVEESKDEDDSKKHATRAKVSTPSESGRGRGTARRGRKATK